MRKALIILTILSLNFTALSFYNKVSAAIVNINITRDYTIAKDASAANVKETRTVVNNTSDRVITKSGNKEVFTITALYEDPSNRTILEKLVSTAKITGGGVTLPYSVTYEADSAILSVNYPQDIPANGSYTFLFEYTNDQLSQKNGALTDIYVQAFADNFKFSSGNVDYTYTTRVNVPKSLGELNFVVPEPKEKSTTSEFDTYVFSQDQLVGNYVWIQRGKTQYYKFEISQIIPATEEFNTGNRNEFKMIIPRSFNGVKIDQEILFEKISPEPDYIETDSDGNLIGVFQFNSNKSQTITITGYAQVNVLEKFDITKAGTLADFGSELSSTYFADAPFWEVESQAIQNKAMELKANSQDVYTIVNTTYDFIVDSIDYSQVKRFGINERQGALKTLNGGAAVCMEYSDLYISLLRAQGVAARAAFGYGYDPKSPADQQELHQWVQVYLPSLDHWLNVDPTWGENGPALIGGDMNHFLTHTASIEPNEPPTLSGRTYGSRVTFDPVQFKIEVLETLNRNGLTSESDLLSKYKKQETSTTNKLLEHIGYKFESGLESLSQEGLNLKNSAQLIVLATGAIILIILFFWLTFLMKLFSKKSQKIDKSDFAKI